MKNFKKYLLIILLLIIYILFYSISYANNSINDLSNSVFRLHVIANSDSNEDQNLKYLVRDELISYMNTLCRNATTKEEVIEIAREHSDDFSRIARDVIVRNGFNYDVKISIGNFPFPTKHYGDISLPSGFYDALKVEIGEAKGQNWWCVMFPELCFVDVSNGIVPESSKEELQSSLSDENYNLISSNDSEYKIKFKIVELFENSKIFTAKK